MAPLVLLLALAYVLPDADRIPAPTEPQRARIDRALTALRTESGETAERAVRDLALVGDCALPSITARLNRAGAPERLLLLTAVRRMPLGRPLLAQARDDPHPAIRAWVAPRRGRPASDLRRLAADYLDVLAVAEEKLRRDVDADLRGVKPLGRDTDAFERHRDRMEDRRLAAIVQARRDRIARRFAVEGALALASGDLPLDLTDPVFVAYLGLLREEGAAFRQAVRGLVAVGPPLAPVIEPLLEREQHDPRKIVRLVCTVRPDRGRPLFARLDAMRPEAARALVGFAPRVLAGAELEAFLDAAAVHEKSTVRAAALDGLLALPAPAGQAIARRLLDVERYARTEFRRAALLLARAGELDLLEEHAVLEVPDDGTERARRLSWLRRATRAALRSAEGPAAEEAGQRLLAAGRPDVRVVGLELVRDRDRLIGLARSAADARFAAEAATRAVALHGQSAARDAVAALLARDVTVPLPLLQELRRQGHFDLLIELGAADDTDTRRYALRALGDVGRLDARHEAAVLALYDKAPATMRDTALGAILPLGTEAVRQRCVALGAEALPALRSRVELKHRLPWAIPLGPLLQDADTARLRVVAQIAEGMPGVESGIFLRLFDAWGALKGEARIDGEPESGVAQRRLTLLDGLARSDDRKSADVLFGRVLDGSLAEPELVLATLKAAARLVAPERLALLMPKLRRLVRDEHPGPDKQPAPYNGLRAHFLFGGLDAVCYARVDAALDDLCDFLLDPELQPASVEWRRESWIPRRVADGLRLFPADKVGPAFERALARADADGRLAAIHPQRLHWLATYCRSERRFGRWLGEVGLPLTEVLERLPWERGEIALERMLQLGSQKRYEEAAQVARADAENKRARAYTARDGRYTPAYMEGRALLYEALAARDAKMAVAAEPKLASDPLLYYVAAWYHRFYLDDLASAERTATRAVHDTAMLDHIHRDLLAAVRIAQQRPGEALALLDPLRTLPVKRWSSTGWHLLFAAEAHLQLGDVNQARHDLENALAEDRRLLPTAQAMPVFASLKEVFDQLEEDFYDAFFSIN